MGTIIMTGLAFSHPTMVIRAIDQVVAIITTAEVVGSTTIPKVEDNMVVLRAHVI